MKTNQQKWWIRFLTLALLISATSCASDIVAPDLSEEDQSHDSPKYLTLNISAPGDNSVTYEGAGTRGTVAAEEHEKLIESLKLYIIEYPKNNNYIYNGATLDIINLSFKENTKSITNEIRIDNYIGKKVTLFLIANDSGEITNFDDDPIIGCLKFYPNMNEKSADIWYANPDNKTLTMYYCSNEEYPDGIEIKNESLIVDAVLKRHVARLDIANFTPDLTVKDSYLIGACNYYNGYPDFGMGDLNLKKDILNKLSDISSFKSTLTGEENETQFNAKKKDNTKTFFYMAPYNSGDDYGYTTAVIEYSIQKEGGVARTGKLEVPFVKDGKSIDILPNTRYIIQLGDGTPIADGNAVPEAQIVVNDWDTEGNVNFEGVFDSSNDSKKQ